MTLIKKSSYSKNFIISTVVLSTLVLSGCGIADNSSEQKIILPAEKFDLTHWKINTPTDTDNDGVVDNISVKEIQTYQHPDYFYINNEGNMVFAAPNKAITSVNSTNTRSELHHMLAGVSGKSKAFSNNFALKSNKNAGEFFQKGGNLQATLKVNHVATHAKYTEKPTAFSVVVGQIHAVQDKTRRAEGEGYGWGNEPLKIYYKKWPNHKYGSIFWNYELNLPKDNPDRTDISYPVWGRSWLDSDNPGKQGIALNEAFSYEVNVYEDTMYLTFSTARHGTVNYEINLANNVDAYGKVDKRDHPNGYVGEANFFKAGAYNQCSTKDDPSFRYPACSGTGDWATDKANGDYTEVTFMRLIAGRAKKPKVIKEIQERLGSVPADHFDLSHWKITIPLDIDKNGRADDIDVIELQKFSHPDYFYLDENNHMVFTVPNKGATTSSLASTRSELRQMNRGFNTKIDTHAPANNVVIAAHNEAENFSSIGGKLNATLKVNAVSLRAGYPDKRPAYTVVIGQVHSGKIKGNPGSYGYGNQPIKIYYKKFPGHENGSVFWNYERNLPRNDPNRIDISYPVWGNTWLNKADPGAAGISLDEEISYEINIHENMMYLTFQSEGHPEVKYAVDLSNNVNPYGKADELDNPGGFTGDWFYFKAGAYNECNVKDGSHFVYTACPGTGVWTIDKANGDFTRVTFSKLVLSDSTPVISK